MCVCGCGGWVAMHISWSRQTTGPKGVNPDYIVSNLKVSSVLEACNQHFLCWPLRPDGQNS